MNPLDTGISTVSIRYFARLREVLACEQEQLALPEGVHDVGALLDLLRGRGGPWQAELASGRPVRVAVNQELAQRSSPIAAGDEIAFFPPVTGG
ncbi:MAG: molybdopterin converting factor subunit 1 [Burkholderiales bacterium]